MTIKYYVGLISKPVRTIFTNSTSWCFISEGQIWSHWLQNVYSSNAVIDEKTWVKILAQFFYVTETLTVLHCVNMAEQLGYFWKKFEAKIPLPAFRALTLPLWVRLSPRLDSWVSALVSAALLGVVALFSPLLAWLFSVAYSSASSVRLVINSLKEQEFNT